MFVQIFANSDDFGTQHGLIILLTDGSKRANWLIYSSYVCRREMGAVLDEEMYAFIDCFDAAYAMTHDITYHNSSHHFNILNGLGRPIQNNFQVVSNYGKRLMIVIKETKKSFNEL